MSAPAPPPQAIVMQVVTGYWASFALGTFASLNIADHIAAGQTTTEAITKAVSGHGPSVFRLLRAVASLGFLQLNDNVWSLTTLGETLRSDVQGSQHGFVVALTSPGHASSWNHLTHSVLTGEAGVLKAHGQPIFEYFATHAEESGFFNKAMSNLTATVTPFAAQAIAGLTLPSTPVIADIGGSLGQLLQGVLDVIPQASGIIFDLDGVIEHAKTQLPAQYSGRVSFASGDFFKSVPQADVYTLKHILHDWNDEESVTILTSCVKSLAPGGYVVLVEFIVDPVPTPQQTLMDLNMLAVATGRERTRAEFADLFDRAGLNLTTVVPTPTGMNVLIASKK